MKKSRTKNTTLIALTSSIRQILFLVTQFVSRTAFIHILGAEYLGLNGLFTNILSLLALAELGIGSAISYYLYKPICENNTERIKALLSFYKICYRVIGCSMIGLGVLICPILPKVVNFGQGGGFGDVNLYTTYILFLLNTASTYLVFAYKQALPAANQEQYKFEGINILFVLLSCIIDVIVLISFKQYIVYLVAKLMFSIVKNIVVAKRIDDEYPYIKEKNVETIDKKEIGAFFSDLKDVAMFKLGSALYNSADNLIISKMLGTVTVGYYSNYFLIITAVNSIISVLVKSVTAGIGNLTAEEDSAEVRYKSFLQIDFLAYVIVTVSTVVLYQVLNSFIYVWVGSENSNYLLSQTVVLFLCVNFYIDGTAQVINIFREASGHFSIGRNLQIAGGLINIILSIILGFFYGLEGIFASTIICKSIVSVFPFFVKVSGQVFKKKPSIVFLRYIYYSFVVVIIAAISWITNRKIHMTNIVGLICEIIISVFISIIVLLLFFVRSYEFKQNLSRFVRICMERRRR